MGTHARIENGFISIDTRAWLDQRTGGPLQELTTDLRTWAATQDPRLAAPAEDPGAVDTFAWRQLTLAWCAARGHTGPERLDPLAGPLVIAHEGTRLDREVWLARAVTPDGGPIVVVRLDDDTPAVYDDHVTDTADWFDADTVDIGCPGGHGWTWRTGRELIDGATGSFTTLTLVWGANLDAPFTRCGDCAAHDTGRRAAPCGCDGTPWIVCPVCGQRCDVHLPTL